MDAMTLFHESSVFSFLLSSLLNPCQRWVFWRDQVVPCWGTPEISASAKAAGGTELGSLG